ncbi:TetR/AcrR family transcriptional regulator [Microbacterium caowuchunii]|uniref:TetR family transcriptional regulator n=1 Tax=Microbacterium caowuchunii TaxID=2614638 RepID=A0A5N0TEV3_9MICO|nr:TetR/AcrR family transcriptional regulator C-terminal domain-containing protein [Microbacterium caowuchunii]KAA9133663.1 TetR family transcriptional regulator [Microbacterium caowuchunii]
MPDPAPPARRRGRGERAGLDRDAIVAAARSLDPEAVTMQAVADVLGVDRKALNHHVGGREGLRELLAADTFTRRFAEIHIDPRSDWRDACRAFAEGTRRALLASGNLALQFRTASVSAVSAIRPAEAVIERMLAAGFDRVTAGRALLLLTTISAGFARDEVIGRTSGGHPQVAEFRDLMAHERPAGLDVLQQLDESGFEAFSDEQFAFDVDAFVTAMEARLRG